MRQILILLLSVVCLWGAKVDDPNLIAWNKPYPAHKIAGNIYYVGTNALACYLITTPKGHILINTGFNESVPLIEASIRKLGFRVEDVKYILASHAHSDHVGGNAAMQAHSKAQIVSSKGDAPIIESGGASDWYFGKRYHWPKAKVGRIVADGDVVELGGTKLVAHLTPGHTEGATTWTTTVQENGHTYNVVIVSSASVVAEPLRNNKSYPGMVQDYERTFRILKSLACDIPLAPHGSQYGLDEKYKALQQHPAKNPFIDPEGYRAAIKDAEHAFQEKLAKESAH